MSKKPDLQNYETVKVRKKAFYSVYPDGRIIVDLLLNEQARTVIQASCYKNSKEQADRLPIATGFAQEFKGQGGFANNTSWLENCEESAVGRCLDNAGFSSNNKCSREEIEAASRNKQAFEQVTIATKKKYHQLLDRYHEGKIPEADIAEARAMDLETMKEAIAELEKELDL